MATLATSSSPPNTPPFHRRRKSWGRKLERCCCQTFAYFPLLFVYSLTSWAVVVEVGVSFLAHNGSWYSYFKAALGIALYALANVSYSIAVFTSAGSPLDPRQDWSLSGAWGSGKGRSRAGYEGLPTYEDEDEGMRSEMGQGDENMTTVTAKSSTGKQRYCKKCRCLKPDRTHHCSTCGRCVLKMDHHCPWLATCVGLRNYKPFLLFLIYTSLFCWLCFAVSATWVWAAIMDDSRMQEGIRIVNTILLAVLGGIIGLVLSGFTGWHIYLAVTGQTTIESLEKTRYLSPLRKSMEAQLKPGRHYLGQDGANGEQEQSLLEHLKETHANALPGILRPEEGEDERSQSTTPIPHLTYPQPIDGGSSSSPAKDSLQRSYASLEEQRERERYDAYLDEQDSEKLPNAFDLGWKRNLQHVFGNRPWLWWLPVCNTSGDGWAWEVSPKWTEARAEAGVRREARRREAERWDNQPPVRTFEPPSARRDYRWTPGQGFVNQQTGRQSPAQNNDGGNQMQMLPLDRRKAGSSDEVDNYDTSSSDEDRKQLRQQGLAQQPLASTSNWNDVPDEYLAPRRPGEGRGGSRSRSRGRRKGD